MTKTINIAIDGPSGSGKSTLAKALAKELGYIYIDTGALYRTIGLYAARQGVSPEHPADVVPLLGELSLQMRLAQVKIYMQASHEERAKRRLAELTAKGENVTLEKVLEDIRRRDEADSGREIAPAKPAEDAVFLDNSTLTLEETVEEAMRIIREKLA